MKKLLSLALALALCLCFSTAAFAASPITDVDTDGTNDVGIGGVNTDTHNVTGTATITSAGIVYSVDVAWTSMAFSFTGTQTWDPETLEYSYGEAEAWTGENNVTITNRSNGAILAKVTADLDETVTALGDTAVNFANPDWDTNLREGEFSWFVVRSADNTSGENGAAAALTGQTIVTLTGKPTADITDNAVIGSLTVTIEAH